MFGALAAAAVVAGVLGFLASLLPSPASVVMGVFAATAAFAAFLVVAIKLSPKRHVTFYESEQKRQVLLGTLYGLLRTQFIVVRADDENFAIGEFTRQFTLFDRYTLDLANDRDRTLDRRIAVALGVMLDTGERR